MSTTPDANAESTALPLPTQRYRLYRSYFVGACLSFLVLGAVLAFLQDREIDYFDATQRQHLEALHRGNQAVGKQLIQTERAALVRNQEEIGRAHV